MWRSKKDVTLQLDANYHHTTKSVCLIYAITIIIRTFEGAHPRTDPGIKCLGMRLNLQGNIDKVQIQLQLRGTRRWGQLIGLTKQQRQRYRGRHEVGRTHVRTLTS